MKRIINLYQPLLFLCLCTFHFKASAQMSELTVKEDTFHQQINHILQPLNFSEVTSGLLRERAFNFASLQDYGGRLTKDNVVDLNQFGKIYATLYDASVNPRIKLPDPGPAYMDAWRKEVQDTVIPMAVLLYDYHQFKEDAVKNRLLDTLNAQLHDVPGRTASPYEKKTVLAMAPVQKMAPALNLTFQFDRHLFHSNLEAELAVLEVDFDDNRGYRAVNFDKALSVSYAKEGVRSIKIRVTLLDGSSFHSHTELDVQQALTRTYDLNNPDNEPIPETSEHSGALLNIVLACPEEGLRKPLLIVEGWDPPQTPNVNFDDEFDDFRIRPFGGTERMTDYLEDSGYDLVFLDYNYGSDYIERNAKVVQDAIRWLNNALEDNNSPEEISIIGLSMGGITSRMALVQMEQNGEDHNTKILISMDSPLTGANVPYGIQHWVKHVADLNVGIFWDLEDFVPALEDATDMLKEPASKQMLYFNAFVDDDNNPSNIHHQNFYSTFHQLPAPQNFEYVAISNGSVNAPATAARQRMVAGAKIVDINGDAGDFAASQIEDDFWSGFVEGLADVLMLYGTGAKIDIDVWSMPNFPSSNTKIYHGKYRVFLFAIPIIVSKRDSYVKGTPPIDSAPGGMTEIENDWIDENNLGGLIRIPYNSFCFVPTTSSLDIYDPNGPNFYQSLSDYNYVIQNLTPFDRYIASTDNSVTTYGFPQQNQEHIDWNNRNAAFALTELAAQNELPAAILANRIFNFGRSDQLFDPDNPEQVLRTGDRITQDLTITTNGTDIGELWVNRYGRIAYTDDVDNPANDHHSSFDLYLRESCEEEGVTLTIRDGGKMMIGQRSQASNNGHVFVEDGAAIVIKDGGFLQVDQYSSLVIRDGGTLTIENGGKIRAIKEGKIVIEEGGKLVIDDGAWLDLWWSSATIHIKGELEINGQFTLEGSGYLQFDHTHTLTLNSDFYLKGKGVRFLQLNEKTELNIGNRHLHLDDGIVRYEDNTSIHIGNGGSAFAQRVTFSSVETLLGNTAIYADGATGLEFYFCDFENLGAGIYAANGQAGQTYRTIASDFTNCTTGIWVQDHPKFNCYQSDFYGGDQSATAIKAVNAGQITMSAGTIENYAPFGILSPAVDLQNVTEADFFGTSLLNNKIGISVMDVPELKLRGANIKNSTYFGILAPAGTFSHPENHSNIFMRSGTTLENNEVGVQIDKGGQLIDGTFYGRVIMDCAKLIHNDVGIQGEDVSLEIDALDHCDCDDPAATNPNTFIKNSIPQDYEQFFNICYVDLVGVITAVSARANYWEGNLNAGSDYILRNVGSNGTCQGNDFIPLNTSSQATLPPEGCNNSGPDKPTEDPEDRSRKDQAEVQASTTVSIFPNPTDSWVMITRSKAAFEMAIFDVHGRQVYQSTQAKLQQEVNTSEWPKGIYLIKGKDIETEKQWSKKLIVQ